jgi:gluconokinase
MRIVVMGVTGCGKSTVGARLARELAAPFADADGFHPASNVAKMTAGTPLTDEDRWPWLDRCGQWLADHDDAVMACSALRRAYRDRIRELAGEDVLFVHLAAPQSVLEPRVRERARTEGHFAGPGLLDSQYATLEDLGADERGGVVDVALYGPDAASDAAVAIANAAGR